MVLCADGASDPDAEPDEGETDGYADRLVQRVSQILRHFLYCGFCRAHSGVSTCAEGSAQRTRSGTG